jgi:hypothetical protein
MKKLLLDSINAIGSFYHYLYSDFHEYFYFVGPSIRDGLLVTMSIKNYFFEKSRYYELHFIN